MREDTVGISGTVEYDVEDAAVFIDDMIEMLEEAKKDGAKYIVGFSGNYRGAQYLRLSTEVEWLED